MTYWKAPQHEKPRAPQDGDEFVVPHANLAIGSVDHIRKELIRRDPSFIIAETEMLAHAMADQQAAQAADQLAPNNNNRQPLSQWAEQPIENNIQSKPAVTEAPVNKTTYDPIELAKLLVSQAHEDSPNTTARDFDSLVE